MKFKAEKKYIQLGFTLFFTAVGIMAVYFLFFRLDSIKNNISKINGILAPIFYGLVLAYLMTPLMNVIEKRWIIPLFEKNKTLSKGKNKKKSIRVISVTLTLLLVFMFLYLFFASVVPQLYSSIQNLINQYTVYTNNLVIWINKTLEDNPDIARFLAELINSYSTEADDFLNDVALPAVKSLLIPNMSDILSSLSASIMKLVMFVWNIVIGFIISIYVLSGKEKFARGGVRLSYAFLDTPSANRLVDSIRFTHKTFIGFLSGKVLDSFIIGVLCYILCLFLKMPYAILVSMIVGVTNIIPYFGPYIGAIPSTIIILLVDPRKALTFIIMILILQQFDGNFLGPKILSQSTGLTSFWIIFSITLFGGLMGVIGMVIGVPITAVIASGIEKVTQSLLHKKNLPSESEKYYDVDSITPEGEIHYYDHTYEEEKAKNSIWNKEIKIKNIIAWFDKVFKKIRMFLKEKIQKKK